ncbi:copper amine oxidase N-terminal domain-containing protein [Paenibacillus odorifer]|uniref:Copper amine oxidase-like N-terminal domain-containing protein n=1 Tax=Paenibacillus odorifer TaxID=189426 RepID=A0A1R0Y9P3_9BACL|nr:copper amine oxidase N-terminal domain-containing protein [Paenibacillus odorifer]OMD44031.1 hypothetical protein BSK52_00325 [Paenibacillus odorifer]
MNVKSTKDVVKKSFLAFATAVSLFTITTGGASAAKIQKVVVKVNGTAIEINEAPAYIKDNYTFVPLRFVSEALGAKVTWDNSLKLAIVEITEPKANKVQIALNQQDIVINETIITSVGSAATVQNNRVMVPIRAISEGLGATVGFIPNTSGGGTVLITTPWKTPAQTPSPSTTATPVKDTSDSKYMTWTPTSDQKVTGPVVFKPLTWDASTQTLSFQLPSTITNGDEVWEVSSGLRDGSNGDRKLETGVRQKLLGLSEDFMVAININYLPRNAEIDCYFVMSKSYASKHYGYKGSIDDGLLVYDSHKNMVTLETVYKALGITN